MQSFYRYPENVPIPLKGDVILFRNKKDGFRYLKRSDGSLIRLTNNGNGESYLFPVKISGRIINMTGDNIQGPFETDQGLIISFVSSFGVAPVAVASGYGGSKGAQGAMGAQGQTGTLLNGLGYQVLSDGPTITWDVNDGGFAQVTIAGNRQLNIVNPRAGACYILRVIQGGAGGFSITSPSPKEVVNGGQLLFSSAAGSRDIFSIMFDGTIYSWTYGLNFVSL